MTPSPDSGSLKRARFRQAMDILGEALEMPRASRAAWLNEVCAGDPDLRAEVDSLLLAAEGSGLVDQHLADLVLRETSAELAPEFSLQPGQTLSHYRIEAKLGQGGMGAVYKASDLKLGRTVALKVLRFADGTWQERQRFALEARAASALNHPNIVTIYELGAEDDTDFISMEYVDGETLDAVLGRPEVPRAALLDFARQAAAGIAAAHAAGLVHRDLKPGNIMVSRDGKVKVLDFGLARRPRPPLTAGPLVPDTISLTALSLAPGVVTGTPSWMSPEQAVGATLDFRSDIFSFGVILYEIATGQRPFRGTSPQDILHQVTVFEPPSAATLDPTVPAGLAALIEHCLRKNKEERPASMREVVDSLQRLETAPGTAPVISRRTLLLSVAGAAVLGGGGWYLSREVASSRVTVSLQAQQMADGKPLGDPYLAAPQDVFRAGWRFRLRVRAEAPGFMYVVNDGPGDDGKLRLWVLVSRQISVDSKLLLETGWYVFDSTPGTERLWLVWSTRPLPDLATGPVKDPERERNIRQILIQTSQPLTPGASGTMVLQGHPEILATRLDLKHTM